jgi:hypothetical protein
MREGHYYPSSPCMQYSVPMNTRTHLARDDYRLGDVRLRVPEGYSDFGLPDDSTVGFNQAILGEPSG